MDRRSFLRGVVAVPLAPVVSRRINLYPEVVRRGLAVDPRAFEIAMASLAQAPPTVAPELVPVYLNLWARAMDFPSASSLADRIKATMP